MNDTECATPYACWMLAHQGGWDEILQVLEHAVQAACSAVFARAQSEPEKRGMGTTATVLLIAGAGDQLRGFIAQLEEIGQLKRIDGADWNVEIGAITEVVSDKEGPALLFDNIKGYPKGYRILSNAFRTHDRFGVALGLGSGVHGLNLV